MLVSEGDVVGFWRTVPASPRGNYAWGYVGRVSKSDVRRSPAVRLCARGTVRRVVSRQWVILHHHATGREVQIATRNIIGQWDQITDQTLFEIKMANKARARKAKERRNVRDMQYRKQLNLPFG